MQFLDELVESFVDIPSLLVVQTLDLLFDVLNKLSIVIIDALGIEHEFV